MAIREERPSLAASGEGRSPEAVALPYAHRALAALRAWRPSLRIAVAAVGVTIVVSMAVITANLFAERLRQLAIDGALEHAESIVRVNLDPAVSAHALDMDAALNPVLD